ncbi:GtrA family protein [Microtetraspora niveoalba]|uniref:GtrA family protein n=1 Tax=Microtetraspora niveoalba TaxID=46175 RepID=UPI0008375F2B|nr:GtrA family protein [Microtetraspora niveoalba]
MRGAPFARFLVAGAANTGVTYGLFVVLCRWAPPPVAYSVVFVCGIALSYVLNAAFVFQTRASLRSAVRFPGVYLVQYLTGLALLTVLVHWGVDSRVAMPMTMCVTVPLTFVLSRRVLQGGARRAEAAPAPDRLPV